MCRCHVQSHIWSRAWPSAAISKSVLSKVLVTPPARAPCRRGPSVLETRPQNLRSHFRRNHEFQEPVATASVRPATPLVFPPWPTWTWLVPTDLFCPEMALQASWLPAERTVLRHHYRGQSGPWCRRSGSELCPRSDRGALSVRSSMRSSGSSHRSSAISCRVSIILTDAAASSSWLSMIRSQESGCSRMACSNPSTHASQRSSSVRRS